MKRQSVKRGLFRRETATTETDEELIESLRQVHGELDRYIAESFRVAKAIVRDAGIDPNSLFEPVDCGNGGRVDSGWRINKIHRDDLPVVVDQALNILEDIELRVRTLDLSDSTTRNALWNGVRLASAVDALNANIAWQKPVHAGIGTSMGGRKGSESTHGPKGSRQAKYLRAFQARRAQYPSESKTDSRKAVAAEFKLSPRHGYKTIERATKGQ